MYTIRRTEDIEEARELFKLAFPLDAWPGNDHEYWIARDARDAVVGFCSAIHQPQSNTVFLSSAAVIKSARGAGLQRRMIRVRTAWARKIGALSVVTYTVTRNYESMINLLKCGFRFDVPKNASNKFHYMYLPLGRVPLTEVRFEAFKQMLTCS